MSKKSKTWTDKQYLLAWIFDVGRGLCAFVRTPAKDGILIDCGGPKGGEIIPALNKWILPQCREFRWKDGTPTRIAQVVISHPHIDHFQNIDQVMELKPFLWTCPHDKPSDLLEPDECLDWDLISNPEGFDELIEKYRFSYKTRSLPLQVFRPLNLVPNFSYGVFYIRPPDCEPLITIFDENEGLPKKDYANNTSIMVYFRFSKNSICFTGDMMSSGMKHAIEVGCENRIVGDGIHAKFAKTSSSSESLQKWIRGGCSVLVAPHHGLESGYSSEFFSCLPVKNPRVELVVISEKESRGKSGGSIHNNYQSKEGEKVQGMKITKNDGSSENRLSVTTRSDGHCLIGFRGENEVSVVVSKDMEWILTEGPSWLFS
ncbi:MAG: MBL fold metallo-hydrolase [Planctomycetota bacterium]|jgi:beta-lactamase superfamily II metal-dependent hydrolase